MKKKHVCPWWLGYFLLNPLRKSRHNPDQILGSYLKSGMTALDFGSAMGYFSLPMAGMVGDSGAVYCFDIQEKMLSKLMNRAIKGDLSNIIKPILITGNDTFAPFRKSIDFTLLFAVAHEVPDQQKLFTDLSGMMKSGSLLLFAEPAGHVKKNDFDHSVTLACQAGLEMISDLKISRSHAALFRK